MGIVCKSTVLLKTYASVCLMVALIGCQQQPPAPESPVDNFRKFSERFVANLQKEPSFGHFFRGYFAGHDKFDVETTNSLVSPYIGTLCLESQQKETVVFFGEENITDLWQFTFAFQEGRWEIRTATSTKPRLSTRPNNMLEPSDSPWATGLRKVTQESQAKK